MVFDQNITKKINQILNSNQRHIEDGHKSNIVQDDKEREEYQLIVLKSLAF